MNAGAKNPAGSRSLAIAAPFRFQKAVPRTEEKRRGEAPIGAPVRVMGRPFPPAGGTGFAVRLSHRVRRSAPALVGASPPSDGGTFPPRRPGARSPGTTALTPLSGKPAARVQHPALNPTTTTHRGSILAE